MRPERVAELLGVYCLIGIGSGLLGIEYGSRVGLAVVSISCAMAFLIETK
jgi:hypothetical protein